MCVDFTFYTPPPSWSLLSPGERPRSGDLPGGLARLLVEAIFGGGPPAMETQNPRAQPPFREQLTLDPHPQGDPVQDPDRVGQAGATTVWMATRNSSQRKHREALL